MRQNLVKHNFAKQNIAKHVPQNFAKWQVVLKI